MAGDLKRRPADAALLWAALFAALLPSIFLAGPVAWWVWERNWPGIGWLSRILAVGAALVIPALMLGLAWFGVRWVNNRGADETQDAGGVAQAVQVGGEGETKAKAETKVESTVEAKAETEVVDRLEMEPIAP